MNAILPHPKLYTVNDMVFNDNFSNYTLNSHYWNTFMTSNSNQGGAWDSNGLGGSGMGGLLDADYDEPFEVSVANGLTLNAVQQNVSGENYLNGALIAQNFPVTASVVDTYGKMEFDGGYLQISMKEPSGDGAWPSLWLLPGAGAGHVGNNFEIDIQEGGYRDGAANPNDVMAYHLHTPAGTFGGLIDTGIDLTASFNTFAIDWIPGKSITWYLNGAAVAEITSAQAPIPDEPMELIMSNQVGTSAASSWRTALDGSTPASMPMQIGDVQLYQTPGSGESVTGANVSAQAPAPPVPTVAIASKGGIVASATQIAAGTVDLADAGSTVTVYDGAVKIGSATVASNGQWSTSVTLINQGVNALVASDTNATGTASSAAVSFTLHSVAPAVTISSIGGAVTQAKQTIAGTVDLADAGSMVTIFDGGKSIGSATAGADGKWSASVTLLNQGANAITANDTNIAGTGHSAAIDLTWRQAAAVTNIVGSASGQTYALGDLSYNVSLGGYSNSVTAGDGDDVVSPGAGDAQVKLGGGADSVTLSGFSNVVTAGNGADKVVGGLGNDTVKLGGGVNSVNLGGYYNSVTVGDGANVISAGAGNATVATGAGANTVSLSGFYNSLQLGAGNDVVYGGQGYDSIVLSGGSSTLHLSGVNERVTLNNGARTDIFDTGAGLTVNIAPSIGADVINGFANDSSGVVNLLNGAGGYASSSDVLSALTSDGHGGSLLSLGGGGSLDIVGVAPSGLHASNFSV